MHWKLYHHWQPLQHSHLWWWSVVGLQKWITTGMTTNISQNSSLSFLFPPSHKPAKISTTSEASTGKRRKHSYHIVLSPCCHKVIRSDFEMESQNDYKKTRTSESRDNMKTVRKTPVKNPRVSALLPFVNCAQTWFPPKVIHERQTKNCWYAYVRALVPIFTFVTSAVK